MKTRIVLWLIVVLMSGVFAVPKPAFTRDDDGWSADARKARQLRGRWYLNGDRNKPTEINENGRRLEARNENGQTSRLEVDRHGNIRAADWQDVRGDVSGDRIKWSNGTTWTRKPSRR
jgi:hypothetical protein